MKVNELLTRAQYLAGANDIMGRSMDTNWMQFAYQMFDQVLMDLNNDNRVALRVAPMNYQSSNIEDGWRWNDEGLEDGNVYPMQAAAVYPCPPDFTRIMRAFSGPSELLKVDFSSMFSFIAFSSAANRFSVNNGKIYLVNALNLGITYIPKIELPEMGDDVGVSEEFLPYIINKTAYRIALGQALPSIGRCFSLAQESWDNLMSNQRTNNGNVYQNIYNSINRFNPIGMGL